MLLGIDEVGRGAWAGPLVVGACVLGPNTITGLTDSKLLTPKKRQLLDQQIRSQAIAVGLGWVSAAEIDQIGLSKSLELASRRAIADIRPELYDRIIIDGTKDFLNSPMVTVMKKADLLVPEVSAASIVAKVARDQYMADLTKKPPYANYGFEKHVGYGTLAHTTALANYGTSDQHRRCYKPIAKLLNDIGSEADNGGSGALGEAAAVAWLEKQGFSVFARNWKTKIFEIDMVASRNKILYLVEVKTRTNSYFGDGLAAINQKKLHKLNLASQVIIKNQRFKEFQIQAAVIDVGIFDNNYQVKQFLVVDNVG